MNKTTVRVMERFPRLSTRPEGILARDYVLERLRECDKLEIDFSDVVMTPSFADEFIGKLSTRLGSAEFTRRVRLINTTPRLESLLRFVVAHQTRNGVSP